MLNSVKEFMMINEVPRNLCERVLDYVVSKWANTKGVDQEKVLKVSLVEIIFIQKLQFSHKVFSRFVPKTCELIFVSI